jgi:hypothetical protein
MCAMLGRRAAGTTCPVAHQRWGWSFDGGCVDLLKVID